MIMFFNQVFEQVDLGLGVKQVKKVFFLKGEGRNLIHTFFGLQLATISHSVEVPHPARIDCQQTPMEDQHRQEEEDNLAMALVDIENEEDEEEEVAEGLPEEGSDESDHDLDSELPPPSQADQPLQDSQGPVDLDLDLETELFGEQSPDVVVEEGEGPEPSSGSRADDDDVPVVVDDLKHHRIQQLQRMLSMAKKEATSKNPV